MSIAKYGKSKTSPAVVDYMLRRQKDSEKQPRVIGGTVSGRSKKDIKAEFRDQEKLNPNAKNTILHFSVSFPPAKKIADDDAADYADELMRRMDLDKNLYIVVRHFDKESDEKIDGEDDPEKREKPFAHLHIGVSRVKNDGALVSEWEIAEKLIAATKIVDQKFNLESVAYTKRDERETSERNIKKNEYQMMTRTGKLSVLEEFKDCAEKSLGGKKDLREFVADVRAEGFETLPNVSEATGRMNGFAFSKNGIVFTASRAGSQFKWANLSQTVDYQSERDTAFLLNLKADFQAKKAAAKMEAEKPLRISLKEKIETVTVEANAAEKTAPTSIANSISVEVENETTRERHPNHQSAAGGISIGSNSVEETKFNFKAELPAENAQMEKSSRRESAQGLAEDETDGRKLAPIRDGRTDDQTARSRFKTESDRRTEFESQSQNPIGLSDSENGNGSDARGDERFENLNCRFAVELKNGEGTIFSGADGTGAGEEGFTGLSRIGEENQDENGERTERRRLLGRQPSRIADRSARKAANQSESDNREFSEASRFDSAEDLASSGESGVTGKSEREPTRVFERNRQILDYSALDSVADHDLQHADEQEFKRGIGSGEEGESGFSGTIDSDAEGENETGRGFQLYDERTAADISRSGEVLSNESRRTDKAAPNIEQADLRIAEKTAQMINVKLYGGLLDERIVAAWTAVIEKTEAVKFLDEITASGTLMEQQEMTRQLNRQAAVIAAQLKLPQPALQPQLNSHQLALTLTSIQIANFEKATGVTVNEKTAEVLVRKNKLRAAVPPLSPAQSSAALVESNQTQNGSTQGQTKFVQSPDAFSGLPPGLKFSSQLEFETFAALLNPLSAEFDQDLIERTRRDVQTNEAAARETATLVQIAFGGQFDNFTERVKNDLTERIYDAPASAVEVYNSYSQLDWKKTTDAFAPVMKAIAEQNQKLIDPPADSEVRNRMLAEFAVRQLIEAYESRYNPLNQSVKEEMVESFTSSSELKATEAQQNGIIKSLDRNLEPPKLSSRLEASVYSLTKYDEDKKAQRADDLVAQISKTAEKKAEEEAAAEAQEERQMWL